MIRSLKDIKFNNSSPLTIIFREIDMEPAVRIMKEVEDSNYFGDKLYVKCDISYSYFTKEKYLSYINHEKHPLMHLFF
jgi:hypothetical protein